MVQNVTAGQLPIKPPKYPEVASDAVRVGIIAGRRDARGVQTALAARSSVSRASTFVGGTSPSLERHRRRTSHVIAPHVLRCWT
ncbi:unnamed protein product [Callosobruchus maculatus]|uniref:Uncharacterized protein n=1 Tax=Callosobruchus maculatus TaxID=64391 RepID=A0A653BIL1_CALMS|nr:unnamed protein product [Callosobruchus maculatus]